MGTTFSKLRTIISNVTDITKLHQYVDEALRPILNSDIIDGRLITSLHVVAGTPLKVEHKLDRVPKGYAIVSKDNDVVIYQSSIDDKWITLNVDPIVTTTRTYNITDWTAYSPTLVNISAGEVLFWRRRVGDSLEIHGTFRTNLSITGTFTFSLPVGLTFDTTKLNTVLSFPYGQAEYVDVSPAPDALFQGDVYIPNSAGTALGCRGGSGETTGWNGTIPVVDAADDTIRVSAWGIPINGWTAYTDSTITTYPEATFAIWVF